MPKFYNSLDVFVLPSVNEAFCCALIEAQACGIPIICCKGISTEEVMNEESKQNFLVEPYSPKAIAATVVRLKREHTVTQIDVDLDIDVIMKHFLDQLEIALSS